MEKANCKPRGAVPHFADGGFFGGIKNKLFGPPETMTEKFARQDAELRAKLAGRAAKEPKTAVATPAATPAANPLSEYSGMSALQRREKEAGLKNGGQLKTGQGGHVPGHGKGDKIDAKYEPGEFVVSNAMLDAEPGLRDELSKLRTRVLAKKGMTPEQADAKVFKGGAIRAVNGLDEDKDGYRPSESVLGRAGRNIAAAGDAAFGAVKSVGQALNLGGPDLKGMPLQPAGAGRGQINPAFVTPQPATLDAPVAPSAATPAGALPVSTLDPEITPTTNQPAPAAAPAVAQVTPATPPVTQPSQITRVGNSYSGDNIGTNAQIVNSQGAVRPSGGMISAQNNQAAENLARAGGQTSGFGPSGAIRGGGQVSSMDTSAGHAQNLKELAAIDANKQAQNENMQAQADSTQLTALQQAGRGGVNTLLKTIAARKEGENTTKDRELRAGALRDVNKLAQDRLGLDAKKADVEATGAGFDNQLKDTQVDAAKQLQVAQQEYLNAGDDPVKLKAAERKLVTLGGKQPNDKGQVISLPDTLGDQGQVVRGGQAVLMPDGRLVRPEQQGSAQTKAHPEGTKLTGKDGKNYIVKNGVPVLI